MKYDCAVLFKKWTNLESYFDSHESKFYRDPEKRDTIRAKYAENHMVNLVLLIRYEYDHMNAKNRIFCKVHCPINPLPVKGEFEAPSVNAVEHFLNKMGWDKTDVLTRDILE